MCESAAVIKLFFIPALRKIPLTDTLQTTGGEDKALPGGNLSADFGAKTKLGFSGPLASTAMSELGGSRARNSR